MIISKSRKKRVGWVSGVQAPRIQTTTKPGRRVTQRIHGRKTVCYGARTEHCHMRFHAERGNEGTYRPCVFGFIRG